MEKVQAFTDQIIEVDYFPRDIYSVATSGLTAVFTLIALLFGIIKKSYKDPLGEIITWINFMDMIPSITKIIALFVQLKTIQNCLILEAVTHIGIISSILWITFFGYSLLTYTRYNQMDKISQKLWCFRVIGIIIPIIFAITASFFGNFISSTRTDGMNDKCFHLIIPGTFNYSYFVLRFLPITLCMIVSLAIYIKIMVILRSNQEIKTCNAILLVYPSVCIVCWTPSLTMNMIMSSHAILSPNIVLIQAFRSLSQLQGFFDVILYRGVLACLCNKLFKFLGKLTAKKRHHTSLLDIWSTVVHEKRNSDLSKTLVQAYNPIDESPTKTARASSKQSSYPSEDSL